MAGFTGSSSRTGHPLTRRRSRPLRRRGASETRSRCGVEHFALFTFATTTRIRDDDTDQPSVLIVEDVAG